MIVQPFKQNVIAVVLENYAAAVSCSPVVPQLGGIGLGSGSTGKLGHAWVGGGGGVDVLGGGG